SLTINDVSSFLAFKRTKDLVGARYKDETWFQLFNEEQLARVKKARPDLLITVDRYPSILMINKDKADVVSPSQAIKIVKGGGVKLILNQLFGLSYIMFYLMVSPLLCCFG